MYSDPNRNVWSADQIEALCDNVNLGTTLEYINFLLAIENGGWLSSLVFVPVYGAVQSPFFDIRGFLGVGHSREDCDMTLTYLAIVDDLPANLIPLAFDQSDTLLCYALEQLNGHEVVYWGGYEIEPEKLYPSMKSLAELYETVVEQLRNPISQDEMVSLAKQMPLDYEWWRRSS